MRHLLLRIAAVLTVVMLSGCGPFRPEPKPFAGKFTAELIYLLEQMQDGGDGDFPDVILELASRGASASEAAPVLAKAIAYPRRDSPVASWALVAMGPAAAQAKPELLSNLRSPREDVRRYSAFVLGTIGRPSECAVPAVASLLWDPDPGVRATAAAALQAIAGQTLVEPDWQLNPALPGGGPLDEPEGIVSGEARTWWLETGQLSQWPTQGCSPAG